MNIEEFEIGFAENSKFCGKCEHLNYTEKEQEIAFGNPSHKCLKYKKKLIHDNYHPRILKCQECLDNRR